MARRVRRAVLEKDPQQKRLYNWEHQFRTIRVGAPLTSGRLHKLVRQIAEHYRIPKPLLTTTHFSDRGTLAQASRGEVEFNPRAPTWTPLIVAHEMAHVVQWHYGMYPRHSAHGRQFAGIFLYILHKFGILPHSAAAHSMSHHKVRYFHPLRCRPAGIRNWYANKSTVQSRKQKRPR